MASSKPTKTASGAKSKPAGASALGASLKNIVAAAAPKTPVIPPISEERPQLPPRIAGGTAPAPIAPKSVGLAAISPLPAVQARLAAGAGERKKRTDRLSSIASALAAIDEAEAQGKGYRTVVETTREFLDVAAQTMREFEPNPQVAQLLDFALEFTALSLPLADKETLGKIWAGMKQKKREKLNSRRLATMLRQAQESAAARNSGGAA